MDLVSIITPSYNSEEYISQTIESVLSQTYKNFELIIIDDGSLDNSLEIINKYVVKDERVKLIISKENGGAGIARNEGIKFSKGKFIAFLDSDDLWLPEKLEKQISFMIRNNYNFSFTSYEKINEAGMKMNKIAKAPKEVTYNKALYKNPIGCLTVIYNKEFYGKQYMPEIRKRQDYALWLQLLKTNNGYGLDEVLALYRVRENSISANKFNLLKYEWSIYRDVEKLSLSKSTFYLLSAILIKVKNTL
jgi:teichuronic acid biosynthesis glycosyltransferase TuaG